MKPFKPSRPTKGNKPDPEIQVPQKQNQDDPNKLQKPGGSKDKYVPKPKEKGLNEENPGRDYDNS